MALGASTVFFTETALGAIAAVSEGADSGASTTLVTGESGPTFITVDSQNIYWSDGNGTVGAVRQASLDGGSAQQLAPGDPTASPLAVDSTAVYWAEPTVEGIAVDAQFVYWTVNAHNGSVVKAAKTGGSAPQTLASGQGNPVPIAVDANYVYWGNFDGSILKVAK